MADAPVLERLHVRWGNLRPVAAKSLRFGAAGVLGAIAGATADELVYPLLTSIRGVRLLLLFGTGVWFAIFSSAVTAALFMAVSKYLQGSISLRENLRAGLKLGVIAGFLSGMVAEWLYQFGPNRPLQIFCWGVAGGILGYGLSIGVPNLGRWRGLLAGLIGGWIGGVCFISLAWILHESLGRIAGLAIIGFAIGCAMVIAEAVFRESWLEIAYGPNERKVVNLGREPVTLGGAPNGSTIWIPEGPSPPHKYWSENGRLWLEAAGARTAVAPGHTQQFGKAVVTVRAAGKIAAPAIAAPANATGTLTLWVGGRALPIREGGQLTRFDIRDNSSPAAEREVIGRVVSHRSGPGALGLCNLSTQLWSVRSAGGNERVVQPGQTLGVAAGLHIAFGAAEGEIR